MKKVFLTTGIFCAISMCAFSQNNTTTKLTLQQCLEIGIANNLDVLQSDLQAQTAEVNWKQAKLNLLPDLNGVANHGINQGRSIDPFTNAFINESVKYASYGLSSGVTLFNGLSLQNIIKQNKLTYEASKMTFQQRKDNLTIGVILAYLQVLNNEDVLTQLTNQLDLTKKQVERLEILNKDGAIPPSQLFDLKGQYANDQISIINGKNALELAKLSLFELMNAPYDKNITLERLDIASMAVRYEDTPDKIYQTALEKFALVKAVDYSRQSSEKAVKVAKGGLYPVLNLGANVNTNYSNAATNQTFLNTSDVVSNDYVIVNGNQTPVIKRISNFQSEKISYGDQLNNNRFSQVNLNLRIPIFNSWQQRNRIKLAKIDLKNSVLIEKSTRTELQRSIEQAYINLTTAAERFRALQEQVDAYTESFRAAEILFNSGVGNSIDYLAVKNNYDRANINLITTKYDYILRTKILDFYKGEQLW
ncbi:MAG TPA: TolC family protein [Chitinophagaceae bacterium]|nr:TolC family protein [Chitinophagaceae bacterium]